MPVEAELKVRVRDPAALRKLLCARAVEQQQTYRDRYFDWPSGHLDEQGYEIRLRVVESETESTRLLTVKQPAVDDSGSKPEFETTLADETPVVTMVTALGLFERIAFEKRCRNFRFTEHGRAVLATLAYVPELDETFLEVETLVEDEAELDAGLDVVRSVLRSLGVANDVTDEKYTDAVGARRGNGHSSVSE